VRDMSSSPLPEKDVSKGSHGTDEAELARMGYKQELKCVSCSGMYLTCAEDGLDSRRDLSLVQVSRACLLE
jgi:hypothetical protein